LVVPFPPGGSNDLFARRISQDLGDVLKQPIVVENRPGAGGIVGVVSVARAAPDGYTLMLVSSTFVTTAVIQSKPPYDILRSFVPVALLARGPLIVAVNNEFPANNPQELLSIIRKNPGKYNYATSGTGSLNHFSTELLKVQAGNLQITHVPYRGTGPALIDLIGNHTQLCIASAPALMPMVRAGKIRAIAVTSLNPSPVFPELPTVSSAIPGYEYESWWGVLAPAGTPQSIVTKVNQALNGVLQNPAVKQSFLMEGAEPAPGTAAEFGAVIEKDFDRLKKIAREQNIVAD
jgi:tripartite-type tricarboxylate transporter receptor subunit TctC